MNQQLTEIKVTQIPVITHELQKVGIEVSKRIESLNIENQVATEETINTLKKLRAELNKEATNFESQRKAVKSAVMSPYDDFEAIYKAEIIEKYKSADAALKTTIGQFEEKIKEEKKSNLVVFFNELVLSEKIDFVKFEQIIPEVKLSETEKKYKELIREFIGRVKDDIRLVEVQQYPAEIMAEYKTSLNASKAITTVTERKQKEKEETDRLQFQEFTRRKTILSNLLFIFHDLTKTFNWIEDENVSITLNEVENLSKEDFSAKITEFEVLLESNKPAPTPEPLSAPTVEAPKNIQQPKLYDAKFQVWGTMEQLKSLAEYMKSNGIKFENI